MSCIILSIGTTTLVLKEYVTYMIDLTYGYYILCILLIIGIIAIGFMMIRHIQSKPQADSITLLPKTSTKSQKQDTMNQHTTPLLSDKPRSSLFENI